MCPRPVRNRSSPEAFDLAQKAALFLQSVTYIMTLSVLLYVLSKLLLQGEVALGRGRYLHVLGCR